MFKKDKAKKIFIFISLINSVLVYGDTLSNVIEVLTDESKYSEIENYGVISIGAVGTTIDILADDIEVEYGIMKKLDIHLYGYSLYSKTSSNYLDFKFITPSFNEGSMSVLSGDGGGMKGSFSYKSLDYTGESNGKIESYMGALTGDYGTISGIELDLLRFDYTTMNQTNVNNYSSYYLVGFGGRNPSYEKELLAKIAKRGKLPYDMKIRIMDNSGLYAGYGWSSGENPNALFRYSQDESGENTNKGFVYTYELNPSIYFTFPLGYVKVQYQYRISIADAITTNGFNASLSMIF